MEATGNVDLLILFFNRRRVPLGGRTVLAWVRSGEKFFHMPYPYPTLSYPTLGYPTYFVGSFSFWKGNVGGSKAGIYR